MRKRVLYQKARRALSQVAPVTSGVVVQYNIYATPEGLNSTRSLLRRRPV